MVNTRTLDGVSDNSCTPAVWIAGSSESEPDKIAFIIPRKADWKNELCAPLAPSKRGRAHRQVVAHYTLVGRYRDGKIATRRERESHDCDINPKHSVFRFPKIANTIDRSSLRSVGCITHLARDVLWLAKYVTTLPAHFHSFRPSCIPAAALVTKARHDRLRTLPRSSMAHGALLTVCLTLPSRTARCHERDATTWRCLQNSRQ